MVFYLKTGSANERHLRCLGNDVGRAPAQGVRFCRPWVRRRRHDAFCFPCCVASGVRTGRQRGVGSCRDPWHGPFLPTAAPPLRFAFPLGAPVVTLLSRPGTSFFLIFLIAALPFTCSLLLSPSLPRSGNLIPALEKGDFHLPTNE